jgi:hypothetical protein
LNASGQEIATVECIRAGGRAGQHLGIVSRCRHQNRRSLAVKPLARKHLKPKKSARASADMPKKSARASVDKPAVPSVEPAIGQAPPPLYRSAHRPPHCSMNDPGCRLQTLGVEGENEGTVGRVVGGTVGEGGVMNDPRWACG